MKFVSIILIFSIIIIPYWVNTLILTGFQRINASDYFCKVQRHGTKGTDNLYLGGNILEYCHILRQSRFYRIEKTKHAKKLLPVLNQIFSGAKGDSKFKSKITKTALSCERKKLESGQFIDLPIKVGPAANINMKSISCLSFDASFKWFITGGFLPFSNFIFVQETLPCRIESLVALIDESAKISASDLIPDRYASSWFLHNEDQTVPFNDALCFLKSTLRFRLCAITADAIENFNSDQEELELKLMGNNVTDQEYRPIDLSQNFYYDPKEFSEWCPKVNVSFGGANSYMHYMLYCFVNIQGTVHEFYMSRNTNPHEPTSAFIALNRDGFTEQIVSLEVDVPLLKNVELYNKIFNNTIY